MDKLEKVISKENSGEDRLDSHRNSLEQQKTNIQNNRQAIGETVVANVEQEISKERDYAMEKGSKILGDGGDMLVGINTCNNISDLKKMLQNIKTDKKSFDQIMSI